MMAMAGGLLFAGHGQLPPLATQRQTIRFLLNKDSLFVYKGA
jgi:hypothetical protein